MSLVVSSSTESEADLRKEMGLTPTPAGEAPSEITPQVVEPEPSAEAPVAEPDVAAEPEPETPAAAADTAEPGDAEPQTDTETEPESPQQRGAKTRKVLEDRAAKALEAKAQAEGRASALEQRIQELERKLAPPAEGKPEAAREPLVIPGLAPEPKYEDFATDAEFIQASIAHGLAKERALTSMREAQQATERTFAERQVSARTKYADYDTAVAPLRDVKLPEPVAAVILESEMGPDMAYYLATHPDQRDVLLRLPEARQVFALGILANQLTQPAGGNGKATAPPVVTSNAPPPITPVRGTGGPSRTVPLEQLPQREFDRIRDEQERAKHR